MIDLNQILYTTTRDHAAQAFSCVASLATATEDGAVPQPIVAVGVGATKDAAQDAAQLAMLKKLTELGFMSEDQEVVHEPDAKLILLFTRHFSEERDSAWILVFGYNEKERK